MDRKQFLQLLGLGALTASGIFSFDKLFSKGTQKTTGALNEAAAKRVLEIMKELRAEGSNIVHKVLNDREYVRSAKGNHYPDKKNEHDKENKTRMFFHAHRPNEYGHFHTFADTEDGKYIHLIMLSMNSYGEPVKISTLNRWVTSDKVVGAEELKKGFEVFKMNKTLYPDPRIPEFVEQVFQAYKGQIYQLFEQRDVAIAQYKKTNKKKNPWKDRTVEAWSSMWIDIYKDTNTIKGS